MTHTDSANASINGELVSVIVPVFNAEPFIDQCLESLVNQSYRNIEILVLDDGSRDNSLLKLQTWKKKDARVSVYSRENRGLVATLNELISLCRGRYIARMDADDYCDTDRIRLQIEALNAGLAFVGSDCLIVDEKSARVGRFRFEKKHSGLIVDGYFRTQFCHPSVVFDMAKINRADLFYDSNYAHAEDLELWFRLLKKYRGGNLRRPLLFLRRGHLTNVSALHSEKQLENACKAVQRHTEFPVEPTELRNLRQREDLWSFLFSGVRVGYRISSRSKALGYAYFRKLVLIAVVSIARKLFRI